MKKSVLVMLAIALLFVAACSAPTQSTAGTMAAPPSDPDPAATASPAAVEEMSEVPQAAGATDLDMLTSHPWQWDSFSSLEATFDVDIPTGYTLAFGEDGIVEIVADCNTAIASYRVVSTDAGSLSMDARPRSTDSCSSASRSERILDASGGSGRVCLCQRSAPHRFDGRWGDHGLCAGRGRQP